MASLEKVQKYLSDNPWKKAKDIASNLGCTRKAVNSVLYYNTDIFHKNSSNQWGLEKPVGGLVASSVQEAALTEYRPESIVIVDNIDLVERVKDLLKQRIFLEVRDIAKQLDEPRSIVTRTLHSFQDIFEKSDDDEWFIKSDYIDNTTGTDAEFFDIDIISTPINKLPVAEFQELNRPPQQAVIEARLDRNFLVLAPPGTGKTHTLIERLVYAIAKSYRDIDAGELLVLSFTRAAVGEIRDRIARAIADGAPSGLRYVQVKTFDAYATWLLNDGDYDISGKTYDARIKLLTEKLESMELDQITQRISRARYLFVDEIQDLIGVRADMVFELVKRILARKGSVTLLGDPHQSLNDYQIKGNQTDSAEFLLKVQNHLSGRLEQFELEESHRYETPEMKQLAANAKLILDNTEMMAKDKFSALVELIPEISQEELIEKFNGEAVDALLCRSNGEVFQWLNWHQVQGNSCTVNAGAIGRPWPAWIGEVVMHYQSGVMTYEHLMSRIQSSVGALANPAVDEINEFLNKERLLRNNAVSLEEVAFRLKYLSPAVKGDTSEKGLIVSTVHKAKGLEYKNVVVVEPRIQKKKGITDEEVRVLYVAITRAKRGISLLPKEETPFNGWMSKRKGGHLGYTESGIKYLQVIGLEDFNLETLFINNNGGFDTSNFEKFQLCYQADQSYRIQPEICNGENDHSYALFLNSTLGPIRLCAVGAEMKKSLDAMSWGNGYGENGATLNCGDNSEYQTIVHPMTSPILTRHIGPAGIMVFPLIQGFYPLSKATGE